jgi:hypothetical protein
MMRAQIQLEQLFSLALVRRDDSRKNTYHIVTQVSAVDSRQHHF